MSVSLDAKRKKREHKGTRWKQRRLPCKRHDFYKHSETSSHTTYLPQTRPSENSEFHLLPSRTPRPKLFRSFYQLDGSTRAENGKVPNFLRGWENNAKQCRLLVEYAAKFGDIERFGKECQSVAAYFTQEFWRPHALIPTLKVKRRPKIDLQKFGLVGSQRQN